MRGDGVVVEVGAIALLWTLLIEFMIILIMSAKIKSIIVREAAAVQSVVVRFHKLAKRYSTASRTIMPNSIKPRMASVFACHNCKFFIGA